MSVRPPAGWDLLALALVAGLVAVLPFALYGFSRYPGSRLPDGWAYAAYGQYLWTYSHGTGGPLEPLYTYATTLLYTRYVAASTLALLSPLIAAGDTQLKMPLL